MTAITKQVPTRRYGRWLMFAAGFVWLAFSSGCHSTRCDQTRHLCSPICFSCDDYCRKGAPPVCVKPCPSGAKR